MPFARLAAIWFASSPHAEQLMNSVSPSSHWPVSRLYARVDAAMLKFATALLLLVVRTSGSRVRLPAIVMMVSPAMVYFPSLVSAVGVSSVTVASTVSGAGSRCCG